MRESGVGLIPDQLEGLSGSRPRPPRSGPSGGTPPSPGPGTSRSGRRASSPSPDPGGARRTRTAAPSGPPRDHSRAEPERLRDLDADHAAPPELDPPAVREHPLRLHARLGVREVPGAELDPLEPEALVELPNNPEEHRQGGAILHHDALDLVELREVLPVQRVPPEVPADDERLLRGRGVVHEVLQRDRGRVAPEDRLLRLPAVPRVPPPLAPRAVPALVDLRDPAHDVLCREPEGGGRVHVQRVEDVPRGMVLGLEQRVEVPERGLHPVPGDLREPHPEEDPPDLLDVLREDVDLPGVDRRRERPDVVRADLDGLPLPAPEELRGELRDLLLQLEALRDDLAARVREADLPPHALPLRDDLPAGPQVLQDRGVDLLLRELALREAGDHLLIPRFSLQGRVPALRDRDCRAAAGPLDGDPPLLPHPPQG